MVGRQVRGRVRQIVMALLHRLIASSLGEGRSGRNSRWSNTTTCDDKVILLAHSPRGLNNLAFFVSDYLDSFKVDAEGEAEFGKVG